MEAFEIKDELYCVNFSSFKKSSDGFMEFLLSITSDKFEVKKEVEYYYTTHSLSVFFNDLRQNSFKPNFVQEWCDQSGIKLISKIDSKGKCIITFEILSGLEHAWKFSVDLNFENNSIDSLCEEFLEFVESKEL